VRFWGRGWHDAEETMICRLLMPPVPPAVWWWCVELDKCVVHVLYTLHHVLTEIPFAGHEFLLITTPIKVVRKTSIRILTCLYFGLAKSSAMYLIAFFAYPIDRQARVFFSYSCPSSISRTRPLLRPTHSCEPPSPFRSYAHRLAISDFRYISPYFFHTFQGAQLHHTWLA
jgi:hypothetical protein